MNITFAGCGFLGIYHVGVGSCFAVHAPNLIQKAGGASAGALAACCMLCGADLGKITEDVLNTATNARSRTLGPLSPRFDINQVVLDGLKRILPPDAHKIVSGRLFVSLTRVSDRKNVVVSEFASKADLIQALLCSAFVPFYSGIMPPIYRGTRYVDGAMSDNLPHFSGKTVTVSPFSGESDICPASEEISRYLQITISNTHIQLTATNLYRLSRALFPPDPKVLGQMCKQGFNDAMAYLKTNNLLPCEKHQKASRTISLPAIEMTMREPLEKRRSQLQRPMFYLGDDEGSPAEGDLDRDSGLSEEEEEDGIDLAEDEIRMEEIEEMKEMWQTWESEDFFDDNEDCKDCKQGSNSLSLDPALPPQVIDALQASCRKVNSGLANFLYNSRLGSVLQIASVPYVLPFETAYSLTRRFVKWLPYLPTDFQWFISGLIKAVEHIMCNMKDNKAFRARFSCHLDMTEDYVSDFAKHWFRVTRQNSDKRRLKNNIEALDIASGPSSNVRHNLNFEFSMDFETSTANNDGPPDSYNLISEDQSVTCREPQMKPKPEPSSVDDEINVGTQESFDYTIKVAQDMEDALYFHYLQVSQVVSYDQGQSSVEIHEI